MKQAYAAPRTSGLSEMDLKGFVDLLIRQRRIVVVTFCIIFGATLTYTVTAKRVFEATAKVRISMRQMQTAILQGSAEQGPSVNQVQNELEVLMSNSLADIAAQKLLEKKYVDSAGGTLINLVRASDGQEGHDTLASLPEIAARVRGSVEFEPVRESDVIKITGMSTTPAEAALIANTYAESYYDRNVYSSRTKSRSFREFLETQVSDKQRKLAKAEESLRRYMEQKGVVSLDEESKKVIDQLTQLEAQRNSVDISIESLENTMKSYREQVSQQEQSVAKVMGEANDPYIRLLQDQLAQLEVQHDITVAQNPEYVGKEVYNSKLNEIDAQVKELRAKLKKRTDEFLANLLPEAGSGGATRDPAGYLRQVKQKLLESHIELQSLLARKKALTEAINDYNKRFEFLPKKTMEFARLQREKMSVEKLYLAVEEKYNEASIMERAEIGYVDIFDPAAVPVVPSSPNARKNIMMGAFGGILCALLSAFVWDRLSEKVVTPDQLRKLGFDVLATVVRMNSGQKQQPMKAGTTLRATPDLMILENPFSSVAEAYRQIRSNLRHKLEGRKSAAVVVTSSQGGEGKTTTVCNLAVAFAQSGKKVLLIDTDLRQPMVHNQFNIEISPGMAEVLGKRKSFDQAIRKEVLENLDIFPSGEIAPDPSELLSSEGFRTLIDIARSRYDIVLLDSAPVLAVSDTAEVSPLVDIVVLVVAAGTTNVTSLNRSVEVLSGVGVRVGGVVLNNLDSRGMYGYFGKYAEGYYGYAGRHTNARREGGNEENRA